MWLLKQYLLKWTEAANNSFIYKDRYIVTSVKSGLMIIERRLALERIMYEKIILQLQQGQKATQALLFVFDLLGRDAAATRALFGQTLAQQGQFDLSR